MLTWLLYVHGLITAVLAVGWYTERVKRFEEQDLFFERDESTSGLVRELRAALKDAQAEAQKWHVAWANETATNTCKVRAL